MNDREQPTMGTRPMAGGARRAPAASGLRLAGVAATLALMLAAAAGCGSDDSNATSTPQASDAQAAAPKLARQPPRRGEILIDGESAPAIYGPFSGTGPYLLRFERHQPPTETSSAPVGPLVATTVSQAGGQPQQVLVNSGDRRGRYEVFLSGKFLIDVPVADAPYLIRLTPLSRRAR